MVERISSLAAICRKAAIPVIYCTAVLPADPQNFVSTCKLAALMRREPSFRAGHPAVEIDPRLRPHPTDIIVERAQGITPFYGDTLESNLRELGVETLILAGVSTNIALAGLTIGAVNRGWTVVLPEDCTSGAPPEMHAMMLQHFYALTASVTDLQSLKIRLADKPPITKH
jgi:nicotinamidase-related amidase